MAEDDFVLETALVQPFGLRHTQTFGDAQASYTIRQTAGMTRTRHYSSTGPATYNAIPGTNKRTRKVNGGTAVWTSGVYLQDAPSGSALSIRDFGDVSKKVIDVTSVGDTNVAGNLTAGQGSTITTSNLVFGSGSRLDSADFEELVIGGYATPARVQVQKTSASSVSTLTAAAWSPATVAGRLLLMLVNWPGNVAVSAAPSGWTLANNGAHGGNATKGWTYLYYKVAAGADAAPAITLTGATTIDIITAEYSGLSATPLDVTSGQSGISTGPTVTSAVTTQAYELAVGVMGSAAGGAQSAATGGFTLVDQIGSSESVALLERVLTSKVQVTPADTLTSSTEWLALVATFKASTSSVTTPASGKVRIYAKTGPLLVWKDSAGVEYSLATLQKRTLYIPAQQFTLDNATAVTIGTTPDKIAALGLADGVQRNAYTTFVMPLDAVAGAFTIRPIWSPGATDATSHTVEWFIEYQLMTGQVLTGGGSSLFFVGDSAARTLERQVVETGAASAFTPSAGEQVRLAIGRDGANASDTYVGQVNVLGVRIDYVSTT